MVGPYPLRRFARPGLLRWSSPRTGAEAATETATDTATGSFVA